MSQTSCLVRPSPEVSTNWSCSPSPITKCIVLRWQLMQSRNPAAARISRRLAPPATTILPHHLLCDSFRKVSARKRPNLMQDGFSSSGWVRCDLRTSGASPVSRLLPHRLRWSKLQPPREWRNGRRAGLRSSNSLSGEAHSLRLQPYCDRRRSDIGRRSMAARGSQ